MHDIEQESENLSALIIVADSAKLLGQGITIHHDFEACIRFTSPNTPCRVIHTNTGEQLDRDIDLFDSELGDADIVVVIGHGDRTGIRISSDKDDTWKEFAQRIQPLQPELLVCVACMGTTVLSSRDIFDQLEHLDTIYGFPGKTSQRNSAFFQFLLPAWIRGTVLTDVEWRAIQISAGILARSASIRHTRESIEEMTSGEMLLEAVKEVGLGRIRDSINRRKYE